MRKSLLTVALACAFPVAYAQSSVTLYGIVDVGFENLDVGSVACHSAAKRNLRRLTLGDSRFRRFEARLARAFYA